MTTSTRLKELRDLSSDVVYPTDATSLAAPELSPLPTPESDPAGQDFREMMHRRSTTPFPVAFPYQHGGLNE
jgi:hypothetical protein